MISQQVNLAIEKKIKSQGDDETRYKNKRKRHRDNTPTINEIRNQVSEAKRRLAENSDIKDEERERLTYIARDIEWTEVHIRQTKIFKTFKKANYKYYE